MALSYRLSTVLVCKGPLFFSFAAQILVGKSCLAYLKFYVTFTELVALITQKLAACGGETVCFLAPKIWISSINHQNLLMRTVWKHKRLNRAENWLVYVCPRLFHIHSKTACRGFESFCPCQRRCLTASLTWPGIPWNSGLFSCFGVVVCGLDCRSPGRVFCRFFVSVRIRF